MGYSWGIRGIFTGYSWDIRMYRVCVGDVSGMCRECVERNGVRVGSSNFMQDNLHNEHIINNLNNIYFSTTCAPINFLVRYAGDRTTTDGTNGHGSVGDRINDNTDNIALESTSSSATQGIEQPRMARTSTDEQAYTRACARDLYIRCIHLVHPGHTIYDKHKK